MLPCKYKGAPISTEIRRRPVMGRLVSLSSDGGRKGVVIVMLLAVTGIRDRVPLHRGKLHFGMNGKVVSRMVHCASGDR